MTTFGEVLRSPDHILILGETGGGKTVLAKRIFERSGGCRIFFNTQHEDIGGDQTPDGLLWDPRMLTKSKMINIRPPRTHSRNATLTPLVCRIANDLMDVGAMKFKVRAKSFFATLIVDEAHIVLPQWVDNDLSLAVRLGKRYGIRIVLITHQPQDLEHASRGNCHNNIIFEMNRTNYPYLKSRGIPLDELEAGTTDGYHFVVWDGRTITPCGKLKL